MHKYSEDLNLFTTGSIEVPFSDEDREEISTHYNCRDVSVYLQTWFAPKDTECGIHNVHDFHEYHVQLSGYGRMEKFTNSESTSRVLYEEIAPGSSQNQIYAIRRGDNWVYPWHQYYAVTDCVWSAIETRIVE